ncbi:tripartite tricarboxylate transporter substrate binding protein|nr:tripartite tricarboxylate transporter substrate binding protein [Dendrosporobacter quercicolus]NSL49679.1 tripartite tricarboxylate transporter substrate binding protein [Dendrosporobacter quercicolus DSM 1736]
MLLCSIGLVVGCGTKETPATAAEKYPDKPITLIVPFAAGGSADLVARSMEKPAEKYLGKTFIIKNIPGGAGTIGWSELIVSEDDGYTLSIVTTGALLQSLYKERQYHYSSALDPLVQVMSEPVIAVTQSEQPWNSMKELIGYAGQNHGKIKFGHPGLGSGSHVVGEMLSVAGGVEFPQVPFKGDSEALAALLGGHVQFILTAPTSVREHVKAGTVKVLGVATDKRISDPVFNSAPTFQEQDINVMYSYWLGIAAHKGLDKEVKAKLLDGLEKIVNDPDFVRNMKAMGVEVEYLNHEDFFQKWLKETRRLTKVVKESGIAEKIAEQKK